MPKLYSLISSKLFDNQQTWLANSLLFILFFSIWFFPRFASIFSETLVFDDYLQWVDNSGLASENNICCNLSLDYRWLASILLCGLTSYLSDVFLGVLPSILAGLGAAGFALLLFKTIKEWGVPLFSALLIPTLILCHPILNELTLWNLTFVGTIWYFFCVLAFRLLSADLTPIRMIFAFLLLTIVMLACEYCSIVFFLLTIAEVMFVYISTSTINIKNSLVKMTIYIVVGLLHILQMKLTDYFINIDEGSRGLIAVTSFAAYMDEKIHGVFNILVNCYMTPLSYYIGIEAAYGAWKWVPVSITLATLITCLILRQSLLVCITAVLATIILPVLPIAPFFLSVQSPESWRVSIPSLIGISLTLLPWIIIVLKNNNLKKYSLSYNIIIISIVSLLVPITYAESRLRVVEAAYDDELAGHIKQYWLNKETNYHVGLIQDGKSISDYSEPASRLSAAYHKRGIISGLNHQFSWRGFLKYHGLSPVELELPANHYFERVERFCKLNSDKCRLDIKQKAQLACEETPDFVQSGTGFRVKHLTNEKITVICQ